MMSTVSIYNLCQCLCFSFIIHYYHLEMYKVNTWSTYQYFNQFVYVYMWHDDIYTKMNETTTTDTWKYEKLLKYKMYQSNTLKLFTNCINVEYSHDHLTFNVKKTKNTEKVEKVKFNNICYKGRTIDKHLIISKSSSISIHWNKIDVFIMERHTYRLHWGLSVNQ